MILLQLLVGALTLIGNAFFVGGEFALVSVRRDQVEPGAHAGDRRARSVLWGLEHISDVMAAAQLGITLCTLVLGVVAEPAISRLITPLFGAGGVTHGLIHPVSFVIALVAATYLHMLLGEMIPKNIALAEPVRSALVLGPPLGALTRGLRPAVSAVNALANVVLRALHVQVRGEVAATFSDAGLARLVQDSGSAGLLDDRAQERLHDALRLGHRVARDVVLPLRRVVYARVGITPEELERLSAESSFSRFPVVDAGRHIVGYLHVKDALDAMPRDVPFQERDIRPIAQVRETTPLDDVLTAMRRGRAHLAAVRGADGRLAGLVTMEDVLRELFGRGYLPGP